MVGIRLSPLGARPFPARLSAVPGAIMHEAIEAKSQFPLLIPESFSFCPLSFLDVRVAS